MFEAITVPDEVGVFSPKEGGKFADEGYLKLPDGKLFRYKISDARPVFILTRVFESEIPVGENILLMTSTPFVEFQDKKYIRKDNKPFEPGEDYLFPNGKTYFCLKLIPTASFLPSFDNWPIPRVLGPGFEPVPEVVEVS